MSELCLGLRNLLLANRKVLLLIRGQKTQSEARIRYAYFFLIRQSCKALTFSSVTVLKSLDQSNQRLWMSQWFPECSFTFNCTPNSLIHHIFNMTILAPWKWQQSGSQGGPLANCLLRTAMSLQHQQYFYHSHNPSSRTGNGPELWSNLLFKCRHQSCLDSKTSALSTLTC